MSFKVFQRLSLNVSRQTQLKAGFLSPVSDKVLALKKKSFEINDLACRQKATGWRGGDTHTPD